MSPLNKIDDNRNIKKIQVKCEDLIKKMRKQKNDTPPSMKQKKKLERKDKKLIKFVVKLVK